MRTTTVVVGAGHCGLAVSRHLAERSIEHVVLERGEVANSWRTQRWDSLRLLTPNWQSRLPGYTYQSHGGTDPDGYMSMPEVIEFISDYARFIQAPVRTGTTVTSVRPSGAGYVVDTDKGLWECKTVVLATGGFNVAKVPELGGSPPAPVTAFSAFEYRNPAGLAPGGVLVVGASATGVQIADEVHRSGRPVTVAVGEHVRMPRLYRGRDILWWMERSGLFDERYDEVDDVVRVRRTPSPQLVGTPERITLDLNALTDQGVRLVGRLAALRGTEALLSGSLTNKCELADLKLGRLLDTFDEWADEHHLDAVGPPERFAPTRVPGSPPLSLDLAQGDIRTIIWATGFKPEYRWLDVPVIDRKGQVRHDGGVVSESPGMYIIGLNFLRRRKSSFILGAVDDSRDLVAHLASHLDSLVAA
jgi:putative flavoprotein involved in K+ transport